MQRRSTSKIGHQARADQPTVGRLLVATIAAALSVVTALSVFAVEAQAASTVTPGSFGALTPSRILDTRTGNGVTKHAVRGRASIAVRVLGRGGVPAAGVSAVVLNVTATGGTSSGYVTVWASGKPRPLASSVNYVKGKTVPNQVIAPVGADGRVALFNGSGGTVNLFADVSGYYRSGTPTATGSFAALTPFRLLDTRRGLGAPRTAVGAEGTLALQVAGHGGVPRTGASAVVLNVTVTAPRAGGYVTVWAHGGPRPTASNLNFNAGNTVANLVVAPIGADGRVSLFNASSGSSHLLADVAGYYLGGAPTGAGDFAPVSPARILDSRRGNGVRAGLIAAHSTVLLQVAGRGAVPATGVSAVEMNVTAVSPRTSGYITVWPSGAARPTASSINFTAAQTVPNLVMAALGPDGRVRLQNNSGSTVALIADVAGYFLARALPVPAVTTSRYVRNIVGAASDQATMSTEGCADARANGVRNSFELLQIGAQTVHTPPLSASDPGVLLSATQTRIDYPALVAALTGYTSGYASCAAAGSGLTLAIGTSSDGDFSVYGAAAKGADWASRVIAPLQGQSPGVTVEGAIDIEAGFAATEAQAELWERAYLGASTGQLVMNGSADACPSAFGDTATTCGAVLNSQQRQVWTKAQYFRLAYSIAPTRLVALPQIYNATQAGQWADIAAAGASGGRIDFIGALTEYGACGSGCSALPTQGWAALFLALASSAATVPASLPVLTDLRAS